MRKPFKRLFALLLVLTMVVGLLPVFHAAAETGISGEGRLDRPITEEDNAILDNDVFAKIAEVEAGTASTMGGISRMTEADYIRIVPQVVKAIESSATYVPGTLQQNGNFLVWETTVGMPCCYDPRMEAELHNTVNDPSPAEIARAEAEAKALLETYTATRGGSATSTKIGLIQPYWESSSSYSDSSFTSYSPYYKTMWQNLYGATGGTGMRYSMTNATVDNIAKTIEECGLVIFDSHGTTDYSGSNGDYTSRANCSYLCLTTNSGVTSTDTAAKSGTYGTYYDCIKGSGYAYVSGQCIANHMTKNAPHSLVYMGICLGMATNGMFKGLRSKGVETVWGYSQSVSFKGERQYMESILGYVKNGDNFATAVSKAKSSLGKWDPAYSSYTQSQCVSNHVAFPIAVSSEDTYPGHGNVDTVQTVYSTWSLFGGTTTSYTVTATSNNTSYGTVSVSGNTITASPKTGYYAAGYTVTSGSATVSQSGNTFTVTPSSDCTVRINFAAKTQYTVTLKANGSTYSTLSAYSGDSVTLPATATAVSGYTFAGWSASTVAETTTKPSYYAPGASYSPTANVTLYAVYTKTEGTGGATVYELMESAPSAWAGNYVITYGTSTSSLYFLKGLSGNTKYESTSAGGSVLYSSTGAAYADGVLSNVPNAYVWKATADGSYVKLQNASTGTYLGSYNGYLYSRSSYSSSYCRWTLSISSGNVTAKNTASSSYPYLSFSSSKYFIVNSSVPTGLYFWKETSGGTTYYTTSPSTTTHTHSYGAWTSNNNGTHSRTCSCGDKETANCTYTSVVTAPTTTSQGYTTYTCTVCGYSYKGDYTDPIDDTTYYTVTFSVPSGVTKPSSQTVAAGGTVTLPTPGAPSGYTFVGWATSTVSDTTTAPTTYTGTVTVNGSVTLYAVYTYTTTSGGSGTAYELLDSAPSDWTGNYIITYGTSTSSLYALKGLSGNKSYESTSAGGSVLYSNTGMTYADGYLTGVSSAYVWKVSATGSYYTLRNASTGAYLGNYSSYLYSRSSYSSTYCRWSLSMDSSGNMTVKSTRSTSYPYLSFSSNNYFIVNRSVPSGLYFWKETTTGGTSVTYYTTG